MDNTSYVALSRQTTLWRQLDTVANNLANLNTPAYREKDMVFTSYLTRTMNDDSVFSEQVNFVQDFGQAEDLAPGKMEETGNPLDMALSGQGYFAIETADGERYTRAGKFALDKDGKIVTSNGDALLTDNGTPIFLAPNESRFTVSPEGTVSTENGTIGKLKLVQFNDEAALKTVGNNIYEPAPGQQAQTASGALVQQGMLEGSNVNGIVEITKLIDLQRSYGHVSQLLDSENDRSKKAVEAWTRQV